jgi:hypothetical protein
MNTNSRIPGKFLFLAGLAVALAAPSLPAQEKPAASFDPVATAALAAMKAKADELHVSGAAVVAYAEGDAVASWSSKMLVVGRMTKAPSGTDKGSNFLGVAYAKAAEMASTLMNSGSGVRPPLTGEFGWQGGVVGKGKTGILIAAFSGGRGEEDVQVSKAGLGVLAGSL